MSAKYKTLHNGAVFTEPPCSSTRYNYRLHFSEYYSDCAIGGQHLVACLVSLFPCYLLYVLRAEGEINILLVDQGRATKVRTKIMCNLSQVA